MYERKVWTRIRRGGHSHAHVGAAWEPHAIRVSYRRTVLSRRAGSTAREDIGGDKHRAPVLEGIAGNTAERRVQAALADTIEGLSVCMLVEVEILLIVWTGGGTEEALGAPPEGELGLEKLVGSAPAAGRGSDR